MKPKAEQNEPNGIFKEIHHLHNQIRWTGFGTVEKELEEIEKRTRDQLIWRCKMRTKPDATCQKIQGAPDNDRQRKPDSVRRPSHPYPVGILYTLPRNNFFQNTPNNRMV